MQILNCSQLIWRKYNKAGIKKALNSVTDENKFILLIGRIFMDTAKMYVNFQTFNHMKAYISVTMGFCNMINEISHHS